MAVITTTGQIDALMDVHLAAFDSAAVAVGDKFYATLIDVYYDVAYGDFSDPVISGNRIETYLYGAGGDVTLVGSGIYSSNPKFTQVDFSGNDGFVFGIKGSFTASSIRLTDISAIWSGDSIRFSGSLNENGNGTIKQASVTSDGLMLVMSGAMTYSDAGALSGSLTSVELSDSTGNAISFKGKIPDPVWGSATGQAFGDLLEVQTLLSGSDTFNVSDAARAWHGYAGNDKLQGGSLGDELHGDEGNDKLYGYAGNDILVGGDGNDSIEGGQGNDTLAGGAGNDKIVDSEGDNQIDAGDGNNKITTQSGNDTIISGSGNDGIAAGDGNNIINAGSGNDKVVSGSGNDIINGGAGADKLTAGSGSDSFIFDNLAQGGVDSISDFLALEDVLVFEDSVFTALAGGIAAENLVVGSAAVAQDANDYLVFNTKGGKLYYDADGNGAGSAIQIASLKGVTGLDLSNLLVE